MLSVNMMIDWSRVEELRRDFGEDDFAEIVVLFLSEVQERLAMMATQPSSEPSEDYHFLKGSAANLGFERLYQACSSAERDGDGGGVRKLCDIFEASKTEFLSGTGITLSAA